MGTNQPKHPTLGTKNYARDAAFFLNRHPFCQVFIARNELSEEGVIRARGKFRGIKVPSATMIHHRHRGAAVELGDRRWWMAACEEQLAWIKKHELDAIALGLLVPKQADSEGKWTNEHGSPARALMTDEYMARKGRRS